MPTILEAVEVKTSASFDGRSFLPLLLGKTQTGWDAVYTQFNHIHGRTPYPMRSIITRDYSYIFNPWSNGKRSYRTAPMAGLTFKAMQKAAEKDPQIKARVNHLVKRNLEEFYDLKKDPDSLNNILGSKDKDSNYEKEITNLREKLLKWMVEIKDPVLDAYKNRHSAEYLEKFMEEFTANARAEKEALVPYEKAKGYRF